MANMMDLEIEVRRLNTEIEAMRRTADNQHLQLCTMLGLSATASFEHIREAVSALAIFGNESSRAFRKAVCASLGVDASSATNDLVLKVLEGRVRESEGTRRQEWKVVAQVAGSIASGWAATGEPWSGERAVEYARDVIKHAKKEG